MIHGEQGIAGLLLDITGDLQPAVPGDGSDVRKGVAALLKNVGAIGKDRGAVVDRGTVVHTVDGAVAQLFSAEVVPVDVSAFKALPCVGIIGDEVLDVVILEEDDVGQRAQVAGRGGQSDGLLHVAGTGLLDDLKLEIGIDILEGGFRGFQSGDVEVGIPGVDGQGVFAVCEGNTAGKSQQSNAQRENQGEGEFLFHVPTSKKVFKMEAKPGEKPSDWTKDTNSTGIATHVYVHDIMLSAICKAAFTGKNGKDNHKRKVSILIRENRDRSSP